MQGFARFDKQEVKGLKPSNVVRYKGEMYGIVDEEARDGLEKKQDKLVPGRGIKIEGNVISVDGNLPSSSDNNNTPTVVEQQKLEPGLGVKIDNNKVSMNVKSGKGISMTENDDGSVTFDCNISEPEPFVLESGVGVKVNENKVSMDLKAGKGVSMTENEDGSITINCTVESSEQTVIQETDYANVPNIDFAAW